MHQDLGSRPCRADGFRSGETVLHMSFSLPIPLCPIKERKRILKDKAKNPSPWVCSQGRAGIKRQEVLVPALPRAAASSTCSLSLRNTISIPPVPRPAVATEAPSACAWSDRAGPGFEVTTREVYFRGSSPHPSLPAAQLPAPRDGRPGTQSRA